jgi:hypothetical protein
MSDQEDIKKNGQEEPGYDEINLPKKQYRSFKDECDDDAWWEDRTLPQKILIGIGFGILGIGLLFLLGLVVMALWNWLMPDIFGLKQITYWQAWGLMLLSCILLKSWGSGESNRRSDRKRRKHLRSYIREEQTIGDESEQK